MFFFFFGGVGWIETASEATMLNEEEKETEASPPTLLVIMEMTSCLPTASQVRKVPAGDWAFRGVGQIPTGQPLLRPILTRSSLTVLGGSSC